MKHNALYWRQNRSVEGPVLYTSELWDHFTHGGDPKCSRRWRLRPYLDNHNHRLEPESLEFSRLCLARDLDGGAQGQGLLAPKISPTQRDGESRESQRRQRNGAKGVNDALLEGRSRWGQEAMGW